MAATKTPITWFLIAANAAVFAVELGYGIAQTCAAGGTDIGHTLGGQWWRLGSAMFLHVGVAHVVGNMVVLWLLRGVEALFGTAGFIAVYVASGLLGGVAFLAARQLGFAPFMLSGVGASGAIYGVLGAFVAFVAIRRDRGRQERVAKRLKWVAAVLALEIVLQVEYGSSSLIPHLGGLVTGFVVGVALLVGNRALAPRMARSLTVGGVVIAITIAALATLPALHDAPDFAVELRAFTEVDRTSTMIYEAADRRFDANEITSAEVVSVIEREVLPPLRHARARLDAVTGSSPQVAHAVDVLRTYAADREALYIALESIVGHDTPETRARHQALHDKLEDDKAALKVVMGK